MIANDRSGGHAVSRFADNDRVVAGARPVDRMVNDRVMARPRAVQRRPVARHRGMMVMMVVMVVFATVAPAPAAGPLAAAAVDAAAVPGAARMIAAVADVVAPAGAAAMSKSGAAACGNE